MHYQNLRSLILAGSLVFPWLGATASSAAGEDSSISPVSRKLVLDWDTGANRSDLIPAVGITGFLAALNLYDRAEYGREIYGSTFRSSWDHLRKQPWEFDEDPFTGNQFSHPYMGSMMYGFARSAGHGFWQSLLFSNVGSFTWEMAGERGPPSTNDIITTGQAGSLLGESLFRMASLVLENGGRQPGFWRELGVAALLPSLGFNRLAYGDRFRTIFPSRNPPRFWLLRLGASLDAKVSDNSAGRTVKREEFILDFSMAYGLPGQPGYAYERPFDYFQFEFAALSGAYSHNWLENIFVRGLLWGKEYEAGDNYAGVFGVYGNYAFASPEIFRVSSTAVSLGTTAQWWVARHLALQGSVLGGVGFGGAGTRQFKGERDYHYGVTPQGLVALRLILAEWAMLDLTMREFYVSGTGSDDKTGSETIFRGNVGVTARVIGRHALGIHYVESHRDSHYRSLPDRRQTVGTFSLTYTYLSDTRFGAIGAHQ